MKWDTIPVINTYTINKKEYLCNLMEECLHTYVVWKGSEAYGCRSGDGEESGEIQRNVMIKHVIYMVFIDKI